MTSKLQGRPADGLLQPSRRRFVQGLAAGGAIAGLGPWPRPGWALKGPGQSVLAGFPASNFIGPWVLNPSP